MKQEMKGGGEVEDSELKFPAFPYKPYSILIDFMKFLYESLERGGIAMLESPTGTGKTLSIICSALQWLVNRKQGQHSAVTLDTNQNRTSDDQSGSNNEPDWMRDFVADKDCQTPKKKIKHKKKLGFRSKKSDKSRIQKSFKDLWIHNGVEEDSYDRENKNLTEKSDAGKVDDDKEFLVDEYESE